MRYLSAFLLMALLLAGCSGEEDLAGGVAVGGDGQDLLALQVSEAGWSETPTTITRAGETLNGLRATTGDLPTGYGYGFSLYVYAGSTPMMENRQVKWDGTKARWDYGYDAYWPKTSTGDALKAFAYAPYKAADPWTVTGGVLSSFSTASNGLSPVDLLYAYDSEIERSTGKTELEFHHALAKVSLGAVANSSTSRDMLVSGISVTGSFYTGGDFNLKTGAWSNKTTPSSQTVTIIDENEGQYIYVPAGGQTMVRTTTSDIDYALGRVNLVVEDALSPMIIPGPTVSVTYNYYEQPDLVSPTDDWFHKWTGADGSADQTSEELTEYTNNVGTEVGGYATVMGSAQVYYLDYADLSDYDEMILQGTSGMGLRILMNRQAPFSIVAGNGTSTVTTTSAKQDFPIPISGLQANSTPTVEISPEVTVVVDQATEAAAAGKATIKVTLPENSTTVDATYTVTVKGFTPEATGDEPNFTHTVTITQKAKETIDHYSVSNDANGGLLVEAWSNIGVDGYAVLDLKQYRTADGYVHLNAIKVHPSSTTGTVNKLLLLKSARTEKTITLTDVVTPEQGKDKVLNLRFGKNYEVVIGGAGGASRLMNNE